MKKSQLNAKRQPLLHSVDTGEDGAQNTKWEVGVRHVQQEARSETDRTMIGQKREVFPHEPRYVTLKRLRAGTSTFRSNWIFANPP